MALNWIEGVLRNSRHTGTDLLLLILLAESADRDTGSCYPGRKTLARLMRCSERTVQRTVQTLIDSGELSVRQQSSPFGTNLYTIARAMLERDSFDSPQADAERKGDILVMGGDRFDSPGGDKNVSRGETEMSPKPSVEPSDSKEGHATHVYTAAFESFWAVWPKKGDTKSKAFAAWKKLFRIDHNEALAAVPKWLPYWASIENRLIPDASTYLNQRRWENDPPPIESPRPPNGNGRYIEARDNYGDFSGPDKGGTHDPATGKPIPMHEWGNR
jgi:hypothetical protein